MIKGLKVQRIDTLKTSGVSSKASISIMYGILLLSYVFLYTYAVPKTTYNYYSLG